MNEESDTKCPDCGVEMCQIDKTTFSGSDLREYECPKCGRKQIVDRGTALWQILSEAREHSKDDYQKLQNRAYRTRPVFQEVMISFWQLLNRIVNQPDDQRSFYLFGVDEFVFMIG